MRSCSKTQAASSSYSRVMRTSDMPVQRFRIRAHTLLHKSTYEHIRHKKYLGEHTLHTLHILLHKSTYDIKSTLENIPYCIKSTRKPYFIKSTRKQAHTLHITVHIGTPYCIRVSTHQHVLGSFSHILARCT